MTFWKVNIVIRKCTLDFYLPYFINYNKDLAIQNHCQLWETTSKIFCCLNFVALVKDWYENNRFKFQKLLTILTISNIKRKRNYYGHNKQLNTSKINKQWVRHQRRVFFSRDSRNLSIQLQHLVTARSITISVQQKSF